MTIAIAWIIIHLDKQKLIKRKGENMKADRKKLELAMARVCINSKALAEATQLPRPTLNNVINRRGVSPATLGKVAKALGVDPADLIAEEE